MTTSHTTDHIANGYPSTTAPYTNGHAHHSMDSRQGEYPQSGLSSPKPAEKSEQHSEDSKTDHSAATAQYSSQSDPKLTNASTPTSDYSLNPSSARSGTFPDYIHRGGGYPDASQRYNPTSAPNGTGAHMAQSTSPSKPPTASQTAGEQPLESKAINSDPHIPVDPNIAASSPTYPPQHHYSPYQAQHDPYQTPPAMYPRPPEYGAAYSAPPHGMPAPYGHVPASVSTPPSMQPAGARPPGVSEAYYPANAPTYYRQGGHPLSTVYSFVPIPGTHQQKRPRRRYEEIERMYKCGWNGCEKAYGTLNHLNAHVTMQSHGAKRTPEGMVFTYDEYLIDL